MKTLPIVLLTLSVVSAGAQETAAPAPAPAPASAPAPAQAPAAPRSYTVASGTRMPLVMVNSISTRTAQEGDQVYLETAFPVVVEQKIVIPPGSYVRGTITQVKRPGRVKGRGEVYLRFDSLTLPNGVSRDFRGRVGAVDGSGAETLEKKEGKIQGDTSRGADAGTIATTAVSGAGIGAISAASSGHSGMGAGIGAAAGTAVGLATVLLTRGPEVQLFRGTELDMVLDRSLVFAEEEIRFDGPAFRSSVPAAAPGLRDRDRGRTRLPVPYSYPRPW